MLKWFRNVLNGELEVRDTTADAKRITYLRAKRYPSGGNHNPAARAALYEDVSDDLGGGESPGGSMPAEFAFAFDTVGIADGVVAYTPTVDEWLLNAWFKVAVNFDGTGPSFASFADAGLTGQTGLFAAIDAGTGAAPISISSTAWTPSGTTGFVSATGWPNSLAEIAVNAYVNTNTPLPPLPVILAAGVPVLVWASQDGTQGGDPVGGAAGAASLYLQTAAV